MSERCTCGGSTDFANPLDEVPRRAFDPGDVQCPAPLLSQT
jgi:hypothetical protein